MNAQQRDVYRQCTERHEAMLAGTDSYAVAYQIGYAGRPSPGERYLTHGAWKAGHDHWVQESADTGETPCPTPSPMSQPETSPSCDTSSADCARLDEAPTQTKDREETEMEAVADYHHRNLERRLALTSRVGVLTSAARQVINTLHAAQGAAEAARNLLIDDAITELAFALESGDAP